MEKTDKWPKAIFYDSKNTLFDWNKVWTKASANILKKYDSKVSDKDFQGIWHQLLIAENHRTAFSFYREFTVALQKSLVYTYRYFGIPGTEDDLKFMLDLWDEVEPFPDVLPAFTKQQELTKLLIYSNVETEYLDMMVRKLKGFKPDFYGTMQMSQCCKPSPRAYRWVLENASRELNLDLNFSNVIYCAGVQWDVQGAIACGMKAAFLKRPHDKDPIEGVEPDYIVKDLHELTKIVEENVLGR